MSIRMVDRSFSIKNKIIHSALLKKSMNYDIVSRMDKNVRTRFGFTSLLAEQICSSCSFVLGTGSCFHFKYIRRNDDNHNRNLKNAEDIKASKIMLSAIMVLFKNEIL